MTANTRYVSQRPKAKINSEYLVAKIKEERYTYNALSSILHITPNSLYNKLHGKTDFTAGEIVVLREVLNLTMYDIGQIFFAPNAEKKSHKRAKK